MTDTSFRATFLPVRHLVHGICSDAGWGGPGLSDTSSEVCIGAAEHEARAQQAGTEGPDEA